MMNPFQKSILNSHRVYEGSSVSNIGGAILIEKNPQDLVSYEDYIGIVREIVLKITAFHMQLSSNYELSPVLPQDITIPQMKFSSFEQAQAKCKELIKIPFSSILNVPLYEIISMSYPTGFLFFIKMHHIIGDSATIALLNTVLCEASDCLRNGEPFVCPDYSATFTPMETKYKQKADEFFQTKLADYSITRLTEKETRIPDAQKIGFEITDLSSDLNARFLASIYTYLSCIRSTPKITIGNVLGNRSKKELRSFGMYANTLPLVLHFQGETFGQLMSYINQENLNLLRYSSYPFDEFVSEHDLEEKNFPIQVTYRNDKYLMHSSIGKPVEYFCGSIDTPIRFSGEERDDGFTFYIYYQTSLFEDSFIENMGTAISKIMHTQKETRISDISVLTHYDLQMLQQLNATQQSCKAPDILDCLKSNLSNRDCLIWDNSKMDGVTFLKNCKSIAAFLQQNHYQRIGLRMERSPEMILSAFASLMAGAAFIVLSDEVAAKDSICDCVLTKEDVTTLLQERYTFQEITSYDPTATAYLICTSGSTGKSKCVEISRGSLNRRMDWVHKTYGLSGRILQKTINTFDVSVWEMLSIAYGAKLCLLPHGDEKYPDQIAKAIDRYQINTLHFVPSMLIRFLKYAEQNNLTLSSLSQVIVSGEKLETATANTFFQQFPNKTLLNFYGPAECTIDVTHYKCHPNAVGDIPIGTPVDNTRICILNEQHKPIPVGVSGEICIQGELVGKGYLSTNNQNSGFTTINQVPSYLTGDLGYIGFDGNIYIEGRKDHQIKLRGIRMNIAEIKNIILDTRTVEAVEIIKIKQQIHCFYVGNLDISKVKNDIAKQISVYAIPSTFTQLDTMPSTASGKIDTKALAQFNQSSFAKMELAHTNTTTSITTVEKDLLELANRHVPVALDDNLFQAGFDSITALDLVYQIQEYGYDISFKDLYENVTIRNIAKKMGTKHYFTYLKKTNSKTLLICFPYAGGEPHNFSKIADNLTCDVIGIYISQFNKAITNDEIISKLMNTLPLHSYQHIYVCGHCVGSNLALALGQALTDTLSGIIFITPSVTPKAPAISPWKPFPNFVLRLVLWLAGNPFRSSKYILTRFREDTDRFFDHPMQAASLCPNATIHVLFGKNDLFTHNQKTIIRQLTELTNKDVHFETIPDGKHFLNETHPLELALFIDTITNL